MLAARTRAETANRPTVGLDRAIAAARREYDPWSLRRGSPPPGGPACAAFSYAIMVALRHPPATGCVTQPAGRTAGPGRAGPGRRRRSAHRSRAPLVQ